MSIDQGLEHLLDLDGFWTDVGGGYWVKFVVRWAQIEKKAPDGISYSLTLHDESGQRVFGIDNAHVVRTSRGPAGRSMALHHHLHRGVTVRPYVFRDADTLLDDFWREVQTVLRQAGVD